jgi:hypothetical protein
MPMTDPAKGAPGKAATGKVGPDGSFELTTYRPRDGAIVGKHTVSYSPMQAGEGGDFEEGETPTGLEVNVAPKGKTPPKKPKGLPCEIGGRAEVEVAAGKNDLNIELKSWVPKVEEDDDSDSENRGRRRRNDND